MQKPRFRLPAALACGLLAAGAPAAAQTPADAPATATAVSPVKPSATLACVGATVVYDTTHASNQGAEITGATNGAATSMADKIVLGGSDRYVCQVDVEVFTLASTAPFSLTMSLFTDCTTNGVGGSACGTGTGTFIAGSAVTVANITPPAISTIFTVSFPYPNVNLSSEADNTISVAINASRSDVFWRLGETPTVGSIPAGEPATSFVERCGSTAANNGCSRNFGITNNFSIKISAMSTPVGLQRFVAE